MSALPASTKPPRIVILAESTLAENYKEDTRELARSFAGYLDEPIELAFGTTELFADARFVIHSQDWIRGLELVEPRAPIAASMSSAPFVYKDDGTPDWETMWNGFCELALYGGPPHRGDDTALGAADLAAPANPELDAIAEIRRGIWETTGLYSEPSEPGWLAITCNSRKMAAWLAASIILENVEARCEEERLLVPAHESFSLKNEVKSVITVVAKTNHYWLAHIATQA